jgi:hypothetical protein
MKDNREENGFGRLFKANTTSLLGRDENIQFLSDTKKAEVVWFL